MNCYLHPEAPAVAYCRACGRPLCAVCQRPSEGTLFCQEHVPVANYSNAGGPQSSAANPYLQSAPSAFAAPVSTSPGLAFLLGWIPGVGAIYNGQYLKGLIHAVVFGLLVTLISSVGRSGMEPLFGVILAAFVFYMPFEAFHTAKKRQQGVAVDEWSSLVAPSRYRSRAPVGPILLILLGVLFLLDTLRIIEFRELARFWPVLLIVMGPSCSTIASRLPWHLPNRRPNHRASDRPEGPAMFPPAISWSRVVNNRAALFAQAIRGPILLITIGILFAVHQAGILPFSRTWPLVLIVVGVMKLIERMSMQPPAGGSR